MSTKRITGAQAIIESLVCENVDTIFGYPGGAIMPVYDALYDYIGTVNHVLTRHEQGAIHMAQGYARVSGKVGVCIATSGPGATNLITGIADAMIDSTPLICITGQVASPLLGTDAFQETDVVGISMPVTKWNFQITRTEQIPEVMAKAFYIAQSGRPGPVVIDITKDAQFGQIDFEYKKCTRIRSYVPVPAVSVPMLENAADLINKAKKPMVLVGQGVILGGAEKELLDFLNKSGIPAAWTLLGLSAMPTDYPLNVGMLGMHGNYGPNSKTNECDLLIAIGMRFDDRVTGNTAKYAKQAKIIHFEIDPSEVNKIIKVDVPVLGDVKKTLPLITDLIKEKSYPEWIAEFKECDRIEYEKVIKNDLHPEKVGLTMGEVMRILNEKTNNEGVMVTDVGQHQMVANRYFKFTKSRSCVTSGGLGTMGFGLPAAIGAKLGAPDRVVFSVSGDGGFQMTLQELGVIQQEKIGVKIIILNNQFLGMVRQWQELFFESRYSFTNMTSPDFIKLADSYDIKGKRVTSRENLDAAIEEMLSDDEAYLLEVVVEKEDNVFPMVPTGASVSDIILESPKVEVES